MYKEVEKMTNSKKMNPQKLKDTLLKYALYIILLLLLVVIVAIKPNFLSVGNLISILKQASTKGILAYGVAGIITECFDDYAKVRAVIDDNSNISAKVMPANALCTVEGDLNLYDSGYLLVENIDKDANVSIGDKVVTSPISDLYHSGLIIGYVAKTSYDTNNLTMTAYITPAVDFSNITDVLVITAEKKTVSHE